jgi:outer membrane protein assembly factor BamB
MYGADPTQSNFVPYEGDQPEGRLVRSFGLGEPTQSAPAVVDGVIYAGGMFKVTAIDGDTGQLLWEVPTTGPVHPSPAVAGDLVYLGLLDKRMLSLDRHTGRTVWAFEAEDPIAGSAAVEDGVVYVGSTGGFLYALDAATGKTIWTLKTRGVTASPAAIYQGRVFVTSSEGSLYARDSRTGDPRLHVRTGALTIRSPAAGNGLVYFESGGDVLAVDAHARSLPVQYQLSLVWAQLRLWGLPVPEPPRQPGVRWRVSPDAAEGFLFPPAVTPEAIYLGDTRGLVYAFDSLDGGRLWSFRAGEQVAARPLVVGDRVYFGTVDGAFHALDRFTGEPRWMLSLAAPLDTEPTFAQGRLYLRTRDGRLHLVE